MMIQIAAAFIGSLGFAVFLKMKGKQVLMAGVGGGLTWALFLALQNYMGDCLCQIFGFHICGNLRRIMARVNRAPATIFLTTGAVPLIPGGSLYYTMLGLISNDELMFAENGSKAAIIALAIALGFVIVAIANNLHLRVQKGQ